jgi:mRNA interferase RelE/StbE
VYTLVFSLEAAKTLRKMPRNVAKTIRGKLDQLAVDPYAPNNNLTKLAGREGYRLRVGDWRIIYRINNDILEILVLRIAPRGEVYK